jgi:hypothetical protein
MGVVPSHCTAWASAVSHRHSERDAKPLGQASRCGVDRPGPEGPDPYREARFYQDVLIRYQSYHDDYMCSCGGEAMSGGDVVRCVWVPVAMFRRVRHSMPLSPKDLDPAALPSTEKAPGHDYQGPDTFQVESCGGSTVGRLVAKSCLSTTITILTVPGFSSF